MHVLVGGSSGLIGSALVPRLRSLGHRVTRLVRASPAGEGSVSWNPRAGTLDPRALDDVDAVVHLGGVSLAGGLWTARRKEALRASRVDTTSLLARTMADASPRRPSVFVQSSAVGYYGDRGDEILSESSAAGTGFLADLCRAWEAASRPAEEAGVRVVRVRSGLVLSPRGGVLGTLAPLFRIGLGGRVGSGRQWTAWITLDDAVEVYARMVADPSFRGAVNAVAPEPATNAEFTRALGRALRRPTPFPVPAFLLRLALRGMAEETILSSQRVVPSRLLSAGFAFRDPALEPALAALFRA